MKDFTGGGKEFERDGHAFLRIYKRYFKQFWIFAEAMIHDRDHANSIVADSFMKLWYKGADFEDEDGIKKQLIVIIKCRCIDFLRKKGRPEQDIALLANLPMERDEEWVGLSLVKLAVLKEVIMKLAPKQRYILWEYYVKGRTAKDIAAEMGIQLSTFYGQKEKGLKAAQKLLKKGGLLFFCLLISLPVTANGHSWIKKIWWGSSKISRVCDIS